MSVYFKRLAEQCAVAFLGGVLSAIALAPGELSRAAFTGIAVAGVRAVYGLLARRVNDPEVPSIK
jgi:hypothetical protein